MRRPKFSIRYKFLFLITTLVVGAISMYLLVATQIFKEDKTNLIFDINRAAVSNLRSELNTIINGISEKSRLIAILNEKGQSDIVDQVITNDKTIAYFEIQHPYQDKKTFSNNAFLKLYKTSVDMLTEQAFQDFDLNSVKENSEIFWPIDIKGVAPLIGYAKHIVIENQSGIPVSQVTTIAFLNLEDTHQIIRSSALNQISVFTRSGLPLLSSSKSFLSKTFLNKIIENQVSLGVTKYTDHAQGEFLTAYAKTYNDQLLIVSQIPSDIAFSAVLGLLRRAVLIGSLLITISFIVGIFFSRSLTRPIFTLLKGMGKVARGNLDTHIDVKTQDEIRVLANSFNSMIIDLKTSRNALEDLNKSLESKVKERTHQLEVQNQAVKEAQEALLKTSRLAAVGEIAGRAAHEVLNPLTTIVNRAETIKQSLTKNLSGEMDVLRDIQMQWKKDYNSGGFESLLDEWKKPSSISPDKTLWDEDLDNIEKIKISMENISQNVSNDIGFLIGECDRIVRIVNSMRSLSVVNAVKSKHRIDKLLKDSKNIMMDLFNKHNAELSIEIDQPETEISVDRDEFLQAMTNLLRNSLYAISESQNPHVWIRAKTKDSHLSIQVVDNGSGIDPKDQEKLFKIQFSTKTPDEGTGLGLTISRRFLRAIGGELNFIKSSPFQETVFELRIPLDKQNEEAA